MAEPAAIEVYPHAAMVGLLRLGRTLKYKSGPLASRKPAFIELLGRMERLDALDLRNNARWLELRRAAADATRPVELDRIEDEVDPVMCAHLAWLWHHEAAALQVYGDADNGYIIAPAASHAATGSSCGRRTITDAGLHVLDDP